MRPEEYLRPRSARNLALLILTLALPLPGAAQQPELLWSFDTKG